MKGRERQNDYREGDGKTEGEKQRWEGRQRVRGKERASRRDRMRETEREWRDRVTKTDVGRGGGQ